jgi:hypothetical protein
MEICAGDADWLGIREKPPVYDNEHPEWGICTYIEKQIG